MIFKQEKETCDALDKFDDEEEEDEEMTESSTSESEPEENDVIIKEKSHKKSAFVDTEAEVSEDEDENAEDNDENSEEDEEDEDEDKNSEDNNELKSDEKRSLKRIILNDDDSNDFSDPENNDLKDSKLKELINDLVDENNDNQIDEENLADTISLNSDDEIPLYQIENPDKTPLKTQTKSQFNFTPISCLTESKDFNSLQITTESPSAPSPKVKTNLFESQGMNLTQAFNELENLCSGTFTENIATQKSYDVENSDDFKLNFDEELIEKENVKEKSKGKLVILSSDDENQSNEKTQKKKKRKKKRKLGFSGKNFLFFSRMLFT